MSADIIIKSQTFCYEVSVAGKQLTDTAELADDEDITEHTLSRFDHMSMPLLLNSRNYQT